MRYGKYLWCEFGYDLKDGRNYGLTYTGTTKGGGNMTCCHCLKALKGTVYTFNGADYEEEWYFGPECVKVVFGAGLVDQSGKPAYKH